MKKLENLHYVCRWTTYLACIKSCLDYLGVNMSEAWLYGGTGHAFVLNIHPELCPSGATAWNSTILFELAPNLGHRVAGEAGQKSAPGFAKKQQQAYQYVQQAIDKNLPCFGWELEVPEFYVVYGYDDIGYYYKGVHVEEGKGPKPWQAVGQDETGWLALYSVDRCAPAEDAPVVKAALESALKLASGDRAWFFEGYQGGLAGFDTWIAALEMGKADRGGQAYNAAVWAECRRNAVGFLKEARERLDGPAQPLLHEAAGCYQIVAENLNVVEKLYPFDLAYFEQPALVDETSQAAVAALKTARDAEANGLRLLEQIVAVL